MIIEQVDFVKVILILIIMCLSLICIIMKYKIDNIYNIDKLTGLYLLRAFENEAFLLLDKDLFFAVLYININDFKFINTFYGSANGDAILIKLASILQNISKKMSYYVEFLLIILRC